MAENIGEIYTSSVDRWCGNCNKVIAANEQYVMDYDVFETPSGRKKYRNYPSHIDCKEKKHGNKS